IPRAFLADPNLWIASANGQLPYTQTIAGTGTNVGGMNLPGLNLRLMILSSLSLSLPATIDFNTTWATAEGSVPPGWPAAWSNRGDDLRIQRLDLTPLFHRVILNPNDLRGFGRFTINSTDTNQAVVVTSIR